MDADALLDEQRVTRTAKSCGPDASTLAFKLAGSNSLATVTTKPDHRGEREVSRKTIARGMPGDTGVTVVTNSYAFLFCMRGCGRIVRPAFPAPSEFQMRFITGKTRAPRAARPRRCRCVYKRDRRGVCIGEYRGCLSLPRLCPFVGSRRAKLAVRWREAPGGLRRVHK
jgi:hypothetical protein